MQILNNSSISEEEFNILLEREKNEVFIGENK